MRLILFGGVIGSIATRMCFTDKGILINNLLAKTESVLYEDGPADVTRLEGFLCYY